ncbi:MAG: glycogen/starch synthase [Bacteroidales bacterium]|nr:glycogen/starch synthase [Bacteroidales bacterium]MBO7565771.1 glycogen/starch synthase [Bacteroidales bacterium]
MEKKKILYVSQEMAPYLPKTDLAMMGRYLPQGIQEKKREIRTFMPRYGIINERRHQLHEVIRLSGMNLIIDDTDHSLVIKVASISEARMQVYFIDNEDFFQRKGIVTDEEGNYYPDNDERAIFFARGVLETVKKLRWSPDLVHCQGWITSLVPLYLKNGFKEDPLFSKSKVVYSVYDDEFPGMFPINFAKKIKVAGISEHDLDVVREQPTYENLSKLAINMSDAVIKGHPTVNAEVEKYARECGKPFLDYQTQDTYIDAYSDFYDSIWALDSQHDDKKTK